MYIVFFVKVNITNQKKVDRAEEQSEQNLTEQDKKLRMIRTKNRKETKVVRYETSFESKEKR